MEHEAKLFDLKEQEEKEILTANPLMTSDFHSRMNEDEMKP